MKETECASVVRVVQSALNHCVRHSLGNRAPVTAFTGVLVENSLRTDLPPELAAVRTVDEINLRKVMNIEKLVKSLDEMHREAAEMKTHRREQAISSHNKKTHVRRIDFIVGDYVIVVQRQRCSSHKIRAKCCGPQRVVRGSPIFFSKWRI